MRVNRIVSKTYAEGPGCRFCIWVQGCTHKCKGCFATHTWDVSGGTEFSVEEIIGQIEKVKDSICGVTFLGGEPFLQGQELALIGEYVHSIGKNVITFTGYKYSELSGLPVPGSSELIAVTDLLIDGKFDESLKDLSRPLVGSSNQNFVFLTDRISQQEMMEYKNRFEIRVGSDGVVNINGMGDVQKLEEKFKQKIYF